MIPRMVATMLSAYLQRSMSDELKGMGDELRSAGYKRAMMMVHNSGGMAEVYLARTTGAQGFEKLVVVKRLLAAVPLPVKAA